MQKRLEDLKRRLEVILRRSCGAGRRKAQHAALKRKAEADGRARNVVKQVATAGVNCSLAALVRWLGGFGRHPNHRTRPRQGRCPLTAKRRRSESADEQGRPI